jgi:alkylation response protein AidB-like acyl-CoA dehydrogenase
VFDAELLELPLFDSSHRALAARASEIVRRVVEPRAEGADAADPDAAAGDFLERLATEGLLAHLVPHASGAAPRPDLRSICLVREALAASSALADAAYAVQGLAGHPIARAGTDVQRRRYLPDVSTGVARGAFALTEPEAGSDPGSLAATARREGGEYVLDGTKTLVSNAPIATYFVVFAKTDPDAGHRGLSAFIVDRGTPGLEVSAPIALMAPHSIAGLVLTGCRVAAAQRLGEEGQGLNLALATLDFFRPSVGAAACGMAARALSETRDRIVSRRQFGRALAEFQATRFAVAQMALDLEASRLLVYRAAWKADRSAGRVTREASMAKLFATEAAQRVIDRAVQLHGGLGVQRGTVVERLYREVRALRIYEGTSEIQHLVIAGQVLGS